MDDLATRQANPEAIQPVVAMLVNALSDAGLSAMPFGASMVWAHNRAADPPKDSDPSTWHLNPGLRQVVQLRMLDDGHVGWFWVWHSRGKQPDYEWIAGAYSVREVAARVARVLAVRPEVAP